MPKIDTFAEIVSVESDAVVVRSEAVTEKSKDTFRIKFSNMGKSFPIQKRMDAAAKAGPGAFIMISGLRIEGGGKRIESGSVLDADFTYQVSSDPARCKTGYITAKGIYYAGDDRSKDRLTEVGVWGKSAFKPNSDHYNEFCVRLDQRANEIKTSLRGESLPYHGYMLRAEIDGVLVSYSKPASSVNDIDSRTKNYDPISSKRHILHLAKFTSDVTKHHGDGAKISIIPFTRYTASRAVYRQTGKPVINPHSKPLKAITTKTPRRSTFGEPDRFGGHLTAKLQGSVVISNDYRRDKEKEPLRQWVATRVGVSGSQVLTALIADSPYTKKGLELHNDLDDVLQRKKMTVENKAPIAESNLERTDVDASYPNIKAAPIPEPPSFEAEQDDSKIGKFRFLSADLDDDKQGVALFANPDGSTTRLTLSEIEVRMNVYVSNGMDVSEYEKAHKSVSQINRYFELYAGNDGDGVNSIEPTMS